jgi:outer membrane receptor protein involved in Fe transport
MAPVNVAARNTYGGIYLATAFALTNDLTATASARYNDAHIALRDRLGTALNGSHDYSKLNPALGLTYTPSKDVSLYAGYSEANRAPTPAELSCADASAPCSLTNFFVGDPDLKQVTTQTWEAGARGAHAFEDGTLSWTADLFRTDTHNDILFVSSAILGRAYFQNVAATRRQGGDLSLSFATPTLTETIAYTYVDATFQTPLTLQSEDNPAADATGEIHVLPGDHMPGIPAQTVKLIVDYHPSDIWGVSFAMRGSSGRFLRGDESNLNPKTNPFAVFDIAGHYALTGHAQLWAAITNLFDRKYETFGGFSPTGDVPLAEAPGATDPRSLSPAPPRQFELGLKLAL